jgi:hypothetical protein
MNFFGHAWVAGWFSQQEPFVLGAMLPDLTSLLRLPAPASRHPGLSAGIRLHHDTDRAFHQSRVFAGLEQRARATLAALGLPKGPRRALAHVGVEFLIDEELAQSAPSWSGYTSALQFGGSEPGRSALAWGSAEGEQRFAALCRRLTTLAHVRADIPALIPRLFATLAGRPRLELEPEHAPLVSTWLGEAAPQVSVGLPELLGELEAALKSWRGPR